VAAAANVKWRRARRGDDGFNEFSSNGTGGAISVNPCRDQAGSQHTRIAGGDAMRGGSIPGRGARTS
jgi:hypothetical protein